MHALQFGAGNIGRGFIGKILADAGWKVTFADVDTKIVDHLARDGRYLVEVVGEVARQEMVTGVDAVSSIGEEVIALFKTVDLVTTAVGPSVLPRIAPTLAQGIAARLDAGIDRPLNVIACENAVRATSQLKDVVFAHLPPELAARAEATVGFADSAVDRIVPPAHPDPGQPLKVTVESFSEWIVDRTQLKGWTQEVAGMELTDNLAAFIERKLFTLNTGHAITAYLGFLAGKATIRDAITTPAIRDLVAEAMRESGAVLIRRYHFDPARHAAYIEKILGRFANPYLHDEVARVGREPLRKLSKSDRLLRPLLGTLEFSLPHAALAKGIAAALHYQNDKDAQAVELQAEIASLGVEAALAKIGENSLPASAVAEIAALWREMAR